MTPTYTQTGTYLALVGLVVNALTHFGVNATADQITAIVSGLVLLYGIIHQAIAHYKLAKATGTPTVPTTV